MTVAEILNQGGKPVVAFEFFPAKTEKAKQNLERAAGELTGLEPDFVSVTFGAGGSTREGSHDLAERLLRQTRREVVAYFAGFGLGPDEICATLDAYRDCGVKNILVVRGDAPKQPDFRPHPQSFPYADGLLEFIRKRYDFCLGVAGYPEGHPQAGSREADIEVLKRKADLGAEFVITNYFYDNAVFWEYLEQARKAGVKLPLLPGMMPVYSLKLMDVMSSNCGASVTPGLRKALEGLSDEQPEAVVARGIELAAEQCRDLIRGGAPGFLVYTMNRSESAVGIVRHLRQERVL